MIKIFDSKKRGEKICAECKKLEKQAVHICSIQTTGSKRSIQIGNNTDLVFLHTGNDYAETMYNLLMGNEIHTICYSGGRSLPHWFKETKYSIFKGCVTNGNELNLENFFKEFYE
jgi:hypothetical protein